MSFSFQELIYFVNRGLFFALNGIREEISKVVINLESDNESDSESNDDDSSDGDETEDYEWP
jgi:hypothetical protein